ncbi:MAG: PHP domain-containing protein, partial [Limisphaerales bacterium]
MDNPAVAQIFRETGWMLELRDGASDNSRAYERARQVLLNTSEHLADEAKWPESVRGLSDEIREDLRLLIKEGRSTTHDELRAAHPPGLFELLQLPDFNAPRVHRLRDKLGIESVEDLENACHEGKIRELAEYDESTENRMLDGITFWRSNADRHHLHIAWVKANPILAEFRNLPGVIRCSATGCLRRWTETVPGISILVSAMDTAAVLDYFATRKDVMKVTSRDETTVNVVLRGGLRATLRVVSDRMFPFALAKFTGSQEHYDSLCRRALARGMRLNEFGLYRSVEETSDPKLRVNCLGEEDLYQKLGLDFIPPELRENEGEFEAAAEHHLPPLVEWTGLRGSLHNHSNWSDGRQTLEEMASNAYDMGCSYWAVTDHSVNCFSGKGIDVKKVIAQINDIELVNQRYQDAERPFRLLSGIEVDIKAGGVLDFENEILAQLDVVVASVHQSLGASEIEMTRRFIAAAENRQVQILGHLSGRLLLQREACKVDHKAVIDACAATGTWIELNASPWRLDMDWRHWRYAREQGVKCVVNANAHRAEHGQYLRFGAHLARKGWLTKYD